jgi:hypothetical protein
MILDLLLVALLVARPSFGLAAWIVALIALRHVPLLADEVATMLGLDRYHGLTRMVARYLLPGWAHMSSLLDADTKIPPAAVHVPIPETPGSADTIAIPYQDDMAIRDQFLLAMADQKDERGNWLFSANQIHSAIGGHRATVLAKVRDRRSATLPPAYRADDGTTAPATYPVTKS